MDKLFTLAGTSTLNGVNTYRFATGKPNVRTAKLKRHGHTDVDLIELPTPMTKTDAVAHLVTLGRIAVLPTNRKEKPIELTDEQAQIAAAAAKKAEANEKRRAARAKAKAETIAAQDANFVAELTGGEQIPVPAGDPDAVDETVDETVAEVATEGDGGADELFAAVGATETV